MRPDPDEIKAFLLSHKSDIEIGKIKKAELCLNLGIAERTVYRYMSLLGIKTIVGKRKSKRSQIRAARKTNFKRIMRLEKIVKSLARVLYEVQEDIGAKPHPSVVEILKGKR